MYLVTGLGNPGIKYDWTRHNIGFETINKLAYDHKINISKLKYRSHYGSGTSNAQKIILSKPTTYMNLSGESIRDTVKFNKIDPEHIIVIHDEIALDVGSVKLKFGGGAGGHNGLKSIISCIGTQDFIRVRIGVGAKPQGYELSDWVLSKFATNEYKSIIESVTIASEAVEYILAHGIDKAMNIYNQKSINV